MTTVSMRDLRYPTRAVMRHVDADGTVVVSSHGTPVGALRPIDTGWDPDAWLARLPEPVGDTGLTDAVQRLRDENRAVDHVGQQDRG